MSKRLALGMIGVASWICPTVVIINKPDTFWILGYGFSVVATLFCAIALDSE